MEVLENAGCDVVIPDRVLCCGRPLYDYGMLSRAKRSLEDTFEALEPEIEAGTPIVFLEPSCAAVFRDEMVSLFPDRPAAQRLSRQAFLFDEYLQRIGYRPPRFDRRAIVHGHCHRKALMGMQPTQEMLRAMGIDAELLDSGCCGMAGSFGYERAHYDVSVKAGEHMLLPRVRDAPAESLIVADGFSCREQIAQTTNRRAMHLAEVLAMALPRRLPKPKPARFPWKPSAAAAAIVLGAVLLVRRS